MRIERVQLHDVADQVTYVEGQNRIYLTKRCEFIACVNPHGVCFCVAAKTFQKQEDFICQVQFIFAHSIRYGLVDKQWFNGFGKHMSNKFALTVIMALSLSVFFGSLPPIDTISIYIEGLFLALVLVTLITSICNKKSPNVIFFYFKTDIFIGLFLVFWFVTGIYHESYGIDNLLALLRFVLIAYFVGSYFTGVQIKFTVRILFYLGFTQIFVGVLQLSSILPWVLVDLESGIVKSGLYGVFKDNVSYASALFFTLLIYGEILRGRRRSARIFTVCVILLFIFFSGSRAYLLIAIAYVLYGFLKMRSWQILFTVLLIAPFTLLIELDLGSTNNDFFFFLSPSYINVAMQQRLGVVVELLPQYVSSVDFLLGYGSDKAYAVERLSDDFSFQFLSVLNLPYIIEDVYWFTMLVYYGLFGTVCFAIYLIGMGKACKEIYFFSGWLLRKYLAVFLWSLLALVVLGFTGQVVEIKVFSFYFWFFSGVVLFARRLLMSQESGKHVAREQIHSNLKRPSPEVAHAHC